MGGDGAEAALIEGENSTARRSCRWMQISSINNPINARDLRAVKLNVDYFFIEQAAQVHPAGCCVDDMSPFMVVDDMPPFMPDDMSSCFIPDVLLHPVMASTTPVMITSPSITDFFISSSFH